MANPRIESIDRNAASQRDTFDVPTVAFSRGRLTRIERGGHPIDYRYDRFGRMLRDGALSYGYDKNGKRTNLEYPGGGADVDWLGR